VSDRLADLFDRYAGEVRAGAAPDVDAYLDEAGDERDVLAGMLAAHAAVNPRAELPDDVVDARAAAAPGWDDLIPLLREERGATRGQLVARLADALGRPQSREQVAEYVHLLETGRLEPRGVRPAVVDALARVLAVPRTLLEAARAPVSLPRRDDLTVAFAREAPASAPPVPQALFDEAASRDPVIDDLFTGGDA
jgi:hypothetical protein